MCYSEARTQTGSSERSTMPSPICSPVKPSTCFEMFLKLGGCSNIGGLTFFRSPGRRQWRAERRESPDPCRNGPSAIQPHGAVANDCVQLRVHGPWEICTRITSALTSEDLRPAARQDRANGATSVARSVLSPRRAAGQCGNFGFWIAGLRSIKNRQSKIQNRNSPLLFPVQ